MARRPPPSEDGPGPPDPWATPSTFPPEPTTARAAAQALGRLGPQRLLLALGAVLVLVAGTVFTAVAWERLGVVFQVATLCAVTAALATAAVATTRRGLSSTGEALAWAAGGLAAVDLAAAHELGLLGLDAVADDAFTSGAGAVLTVAAAGLWSVERRLRAPQAVAALAAAVVLPSLAVARSTPDADALGAVPLQTAFLATALGLALVAPRLMSPGQVVALVLVVLAWLAGAVAGLLAVADDDPLPAAVAGLLLALAVAGAVVLPRLLPLPLRAGAATGLASVTLSVAGWRVGEETGLLVVAVLGAAVAATAAAHRAVPLRPAVGVGAAVWLLPVAVLSTDTSGVFTAALAAGAVALLVVAATRDEQRAATASLGAALGLLALLVGLDAAEVGLGPRGLVLALAAAVVLAASGARTATPEEVPLRTVALIGLLLAPAVALDGGAALDLALPGPTAWAAGSLAVAAVALGALAALRLTTALWAEPSAAAAGLAALALGIDAATARPTAGVVLVVGAALAGVGAAVRGGERAPALALVAVIGGALGIAVASSGGLLPTAAATAVAGLTLLGLGAVPGRGSASVPAVGLLSASTWLVLADRDVDVVEAYTLPLAALALLVGLVRLSRDPSAPSWVTHGPAASAALLPSAAVALDGTAATRSLLVAVAATAALLLGMADRRQALVVVGSATLALVAVGQLGPYAVGAPRWATLGALGLLLLWAGATYERRLGDARAMRDWVAGLR